MPGLYDFFSESATNPKIFCLQEKKRTQMKLLSFCLHHWQIFYFIKLHTFLRIFIHLNTLHHLWVLSEQVSNWHVLVTLGPKVWTEWGKCREATQLFSPLSIESVLSTESRSVSVEPQNHFGLCSSTPSFCAAPLTTLEEILALLYI